MIREDSKILSDSFRNSLYIWHCQYCLIPFTGDETALKDADTISELQILKILSIFFERGVAALTWKGLSFAMGKQNGFFSKAVVQ